MELKVPQPLEVEHEELHKELAAATQLSGRIGDAAREVARLLHPHFVAEEEFALPPLALLPGLGEGQATPDMLNVLRMTDRLEAEFPKMLAEHKEIVVALQELIDVAKSENKLEYAKLAEKIILHAQTEEQVLYPAALLIGRYLKLRFNV